MLIKKYIKDVSSIDKTKFSDLLLTLPKYRIAKINQYKLDKDKYLSLLTGLTLKEAFEELGYPSLNEEILFTKEGKPYLPSQYNIYFSISHSNEKVFVVVSDMNIGCDIEFIKDTNHLDIARRFFTNNEYEFLKNNYSNESFYRIWTIKEAYLKVIGNGLLSPLNSVEVDLIKERLSNDNYLIIDNGIIDGYAYSIVVKK